MHYNTSAIVLQQRPLGEKNTILLCITAQYGIVKGLIRQCRGRKIQLLLHAGNLLQINRFSKEDCLGNISAEEQKCYMLLNLHDRKKMHLINVVCSTVAAFFREGSSTTELSHIFQHMIKFFDHLSTQTHCQNSTIAKFILLQKYIITKAGYGFTLSQCVATGDTITTNLIYLSPKSASAVSRTAGHKYQHLLLKLPQFFITERLDHNTNQEIFDGLVLIDYFITRFCDKILSRAVPGDIECGLRYLKQQYQPAQ